MRQRREAPWSLLPGVDRDGLGHRLRRLRLPANIQQVLGWFQDEPATALPFAAIIHCLRSG